jgi:hypothetical protein
MKHPTEIIMLAVDGRREITMGTLAALSYECGARKTLHWIGDNPPPRVPGWDLAFWPGKPSGQKLDMWRALSMAVRETPDADIVYLEDDVLPCKNALTKVVAWNSPYTTLFINTRGVRPGVRLVDNIGFWPLQCVKIPAPVARRLAAENPLAKQWQDKIPNLNINDGDLTIGRMLKAWGLMYYQHQSLFQHVGDVSLCNPRAKLTGARVAQDFPGVDFDALTL